MKFTNRYIVLLVGIFIVGCQSTQDKGSFKSEPSTCQSYSELSGDFRAPLVRVDPKYPRKAAKKKLNGYVKVEFDISSEGKPENINIVKSHPKGLFDENTISALSKWRYSPQEIKCVWLRLDYKLN